MSEPLRVGVYGTPGDHLHEAFVAGALALGAEPHLRNGNAFRKGDTEDFDLAVVCCMRAGGEAIINAYERRRPIVPIYVADFGYLRRVHGVATFETGYWQVSLGGLNAPPTEPCSPDRFDALGLTIAERGGDPRGYTLVCGQFADDQSHGLGDAANILAWAAEVCAQQERVVYRPHPKMRHAEGPPGVPLDASATLDEALAGARLVVTACSTVGIDALLAGVPAVATMPDRAAWGELSGERLPSVEERRALFARLAYGQWTLAELTAGDFYRWYVDDYRFIAPTPAVVEVKEERHGARGGRRKREG